MQILAEINVALHQDFHANDTWPENTFVQRSGATTLISHSRRLFVIVDERRRFLRRALQENFGHGRADCQRDDGVQFFVGGSVDNLSSVSIYPR